MLRVALHHGSSLVSRAIRLQTRSAWNHASLVFPSGMLVESLEGQGVTDTRTLDAVRATERVQTFVVPGLSEPQARAAMAFALAQLGKPYDWTMVLRFITRRQEDRKSTGAWFCSELVAAAFRHAGYPLLHRVEPWAVAPGTLALSPLLVEEAG